MLKLFYDYKNTGKISEALLTGHNLFSRNPANTEIFTAYFEYLCSLAESLPALEERQDFAGRAAIALDFFSENSELSAEIVVDIIEHRQKLSRIINSITSSVKKKADTLNEENARNNGTCLKELYTYKDQLQNANTQEKFDNILVEIGRIDSKIDNDSMTSEQNTVYVALTKELTELISSKMREIEHKNNIIYNSQAVDSFAEAFKRFKEDENKYKNQTQLFSLASKTLFAYDASRLFNETLIYYNHVYSYIFSKLDDDGKLTLTRYSIECERNLR